MKTDFSMIKWHINVIQGHSRVTGKPTKYFIMPHNNIGFNFKGSQDNMATEITKRTSPVLTTPRSFEAPSPRNPHVYPHEPYSI